MAARERELRDAIVTTLQAASDASEFVFSFDVDALFLPKYNLESDVDRVRVNVGVVSRETSTAARTGWGTKTFTVPITITRKANSDTTLWDNLIDLSEDIDDYLRSYGSPLAQCTWVSSSCDPVFDADVADTMAVFRATQIHTYTITEAARN